MRSGGLVSSPVIAPEASAAVGALYSHGRSIIQVLMIHGVDTVGPNCIPSVCLDRVGDILDSCSSGFHLGL